MLETLIIGAGYSGIAAARILHQKGKSFQILEARDRIGGRVFTQQFDDGFYLDFGGQWIGPTQTRMYELVAEYGLEFFKTYNQGMHTIDLNKKIKTFKGLIPNTDILSLLNMEFVVRHLQYQAKSISLSRPFEHPKAKIYDSISLADYIEKQTFTKNARKILKAGLETVFATELANVSLLHALFYIQSGNNLENLLSVENGAQQDRIVGGMQLLAEKMMDPFREHLHLSSPVLEVNLTDKGYEIKCPKQTFFAKSIISAIPPHLLQNISFNPPLSMLKQEILTKLPMGTVAKCFAIYKEPFWRKAGFSGQVIADEHSPFQVIFDTSPKDGSKGVLLGFCIAERHEAFFLCTPEAREEKMVAQLKIYFGEKALALEKYVDYTMKDEEWSGGCYAAIYGKSVWTKNKNALKSSEGNIFFAGTETSDVWYGYIEGAVRAGERAALEAIEALSESEIDFD